MAREVRHPAMRLGEKADGICKIVRSGVDDVLHTMDM